MKMKRSNLIPITRIYDIYPKYTYSDDVKKFMDEIVDIDRANAYSKDEVIAMFEELQSEIKELPTNRMAITDSSGLICYGYSEYEPTAKDASKIIQEKINALKENEDGNK